MRFCIHSQPCAPVDKSAWGKAVLHCAALFLGLTVVVEVAGDEVAPGPQAPLHEGILLKPTTRAQGYAFAKKPTITTDGKQFHIHFATTAYCDVTIGIIRKKDGKIVRHLASGVLGKNAPEPFQKDSLKQTVIWDGKDDHKRYIDDLENHIVKVSLGLKPVFGKIIGWHPKDNTGEVAAIGADGEGVYVLEPSQRPKITMYDHQGNYVRVVFPPAADIPLSKLEGLARQRLPEGGEGLGYSGWGISGFGCLFPLLQGTPEAGYQTLVVSQGRIAFTNNGEGWPKWILRYRTDGSTLDGRALGKQLTEKRDEFIGNSSMAASPDGKWLYLTNLGQRRERIEEHVVFRVGWEEVGPPPLKEPFIGERKHPGEDNYHLNTPRDIACDAQGRIYVADTLNHRIQVFDSEGEYLKTIPVMSPGRVGVHQKTGQVYVIQQDKMLLALGTFENPRLRAAWNFESHDGKGQAEISKSPKVAGLLLSTVVCVDSWAETPTIWIGWVDKRPWPYQGGQVLLLVDRGDHFEVKERFEETVRQAGLFPHMWTGGKMPRVKVDPTREHVYYEGPPGRTHLYRLNTRSGKFEEPVRLPYRADEITFGPGGLIYVRAPLMGVGRFHPETWQEVPFDYGVHLLPRTIFEWADLGGGGSTRDELIGGLRFYDEPGAKGFQDGIGVSLSGEVAVLSNIYDPKWLWFGGRSGYQELVKLQQLMGYRPFRFAGRTLPNQSTVWVFTARGELKGKDLVPGMQVGSCGVATDVKGNIYVGFAGTPQVEGKPFLPRTGSVIKFPATGGRLLGDWLSLVTLDDIPSRPPDFFVPAGHATTMQKSYRAAALAKIRGPQYSEDEKFHRIWTQGALWAYGGLSSMITVQSGMCTCPNNRFALDYYARCFIPETYRFSVGVVDTNGNLITHIGRYGNEDSRGPGSPVSVGGDEIAFAFPCFVAVKDGELYVSDSGNDRIVQVLLDYHVEETLRVPG